MFLPGESQGWGSLEGCRLWGCTESDTTKAKQKQQQKGTVNSYLPLMGSLSQYSAVHTALCVSPSLGPEKQVLVTQSGPTLCHPMDCM